MRIVRHVIGSHVAFGSEKSTVPASNDSEAILCTVFTCHHQLLGVTNKRVTYIGRQLYVSQLSTESAVTRAVTLRATIPAVDRRLIRTRRS